MYCVFELLELMNDKGQLFVMRLADHIESNYDDEVQTIVFNMGRKCLRPEGDNNCDKAFWYHKCWKSKDPVVRNQFSVLFDSIQSLIFTNIGLSALFPLLDSILGESRNSLIEILVVDFLVTYYTLSYFKNVLFRNQFFDFH